MVHVHKSLYHGNHWYKKVVLSCYMSSQQWYYEYMSKNMVLPVYMSKKAWYYDGTISKKQSITMVNFKKIVLLWYTHAKQQ